MSAKDPNAVHLMGLVDLADELLGGRALSANDEFFAEKENLLKPGRGVFLPDEYTDRGKWMDGWETRRRREPGHDWCVLKLGARGKARIFDIDTNHFLGNNPAFASVDGLEADPDADPSSFSESDWVEVLPQSPLRPGSQNLFAAHRPGPWTHLRLNIFPDGGVARFRAWGDVIAGGADAEADESQRARLLPGEVDLGSVKNGALAVACSDMFFGPMNNLILPGRAPNMGNGWETRRRRGPGFDWIVVRLASRGSLGLVEVDTNHFKGNCPGSFKLEGVDAAGAKLTELVDPTLPWVTAVPERKLTPHTRHFYREEAVGHGPFTHVRLSIFPDGGVSRLRLYGRRDEGGA